MRCFPFVFVSVCSLLAQDPPTLSVQQTSPASADISWSENHSDLLLEETSFLGTASRWRLATETPLLQNGRYVVSVRADLSRRFFRLRTPDLTHIAKSSPAHGETGVAVTRETVLRLSQPLAASTVISNTQLYAEAAGRRILSRIELSSDRQTVTLFYLEDLPGSALVQVTFNGQGLLDRLARPLDLDRDGQPGGIATIEFSTLTLTPVAATAVIGTVFASELVPGPDNITQSTNKPLERVTITVDGMEETLRTTTDAQGNFRLEPVPAGRFFVHVDGRTAVGSQWPDGAYYPYVGKAWQAVAGVATNLASGTGEIFLPRIVPGTLKPISLTETTTVTFPQEVLQNNPELAGVSLNVPANNLLSESGTRGGMIGIAPVPPDRLPEPLPPGLEFPIVITVQTDGAANFDQPVPICFPNLPDPGTGQPLPPGTKNYLYSFDHDLGQFVPVGPMTVSQDGKLICTDPGVGIPEPGWHGSGPPPVGPPPPEECEIPSEPGLAQQAAADFSAQNKKPTAQQCLDACRAAREKCLLDLIAWFEARKRSCKETEHITQLTEAACIERASREYHEKQALCVEREVACQDACVDCSPPAGTNRTQAMFDSELSPGLRQFSAQSVVVNQEIDRLLRQASSILWTYISARQPIPESAWQQYDALIADATTISGGNLAGYLRQQLLQAEETLARITGGEYWTVGNAPADPLLYVATVARPTGLFYLRGETGPFGQYTLFIPRDGQLLDVSFYDPRTKSYGTVFPIQSADSRYRVPRLLLGPLPPDAADLDRDGLADIVELVYGTDWDDPDSDKDGVKDGAEVDSGANPLDGIAVRTGVIAAVDTAGTAVDITTLNDLAVVADSDRGVAIFNLSSAAAPILAAAIDTPGTAQAVASSENWAAVADGAAGLAIVDLSNPAAAKLSRQINLGSPVHAVAAAGGVAYAGLVDGRILAVDLASGSVLKEVQAGGRIYDLEIERDTLFALLPNEIRSYTILSAILEPLGTAATSDLGPDSFTDSRRIFVGGGVAYAATRAGFDSFDVANPSVMQILGAVTRGGPNSFKQIVADGSGFGIAAVGVNARADGTHDLWLYDISNPSATGQFLTTLVTPGVARAISIYNGLAYVADAESGLQVVNYREADRSTNPPTITLSFNFTPGKAEEGKTMRVSATVQDDVQVRNVEFYLDEVRVHIDGNFPFEYYFQSPRATAQKTSFRLKARATDTAGNSTWTGDLVFNLVADATPPRVVNLSPKNDLFLAPGGVLTAHWSEPLNPATVNNSTFLLVSAGADGLEGTADDLALTNGTVSYRAETNATVLAFATPVPPGFFRAILKVGITDLAGNPLPSDFIWRFTSAAPIEFGETVQASLQRPGEKHFYAFTAATGDRVRIRMSDTGPITPNLELLDPDGRSLAATYNFGNEARLDHTLETNGTFFFSVSDREGDSTGNYGVFLQRLNAPQGATALQPGQVLAGAIEKLAEADTYTFVAAPGDMIRIGMSDPGPLSPSLELFDSQGQRVAGNYSFGNEALLDYRTETGGTFLFFAADYQGDAIGSYGVSLQRLNAPAGVTAIQFGQTMAGSIQNVAEADAYTFQAAAGDMVRIRMSDPGPLSPRVELFDSQGQKLGANYSFGNEALLDQRVPAAGTYLVLASDYEGKATGNYAVFLQRLNAPAGATAIQFGQSLTSSIDTLAEADAYTFQAAAGDRVRIGLSDPGPLSPRVELFDPQGQKLGSNYSFGNEALLDHLLQAGGTYLILASDYDGNGTSAYAVFLQRLNAPAGATAILFGQSLTGSIDTLAEADAFTFQAAPGDMIRLRMSDPGPLSPRVELFDPQGQKLGANYSFGNEALLDYRAEAGGTFLLLASGYQGDGTGDYGIYVQRLNTPAGAMPLAFGQPLTASINRLAEADAYLIEAAAGDLLRIRMTDPGPLSPKIELFDVQGQRLAQKSSFGNETLLEHLIPNTGTFFLLASDNDGSNLGSYTLVVDR